jgi:hypothetical protein
VSQHRQHVSLDAPEHCWCANSDGGIPYSDVPSPMLIRLTRDGRFDLTLFLGANTSLGVSDVTLEQIEHLAAALVHEAAEQRQQSPAT